MSQSLAVKYRPKTFEEVVGQSITTEILKKQIENKTFKNAYLFSGHSGCGKTTSARIFARMINNGVGDPIEKDATTFGVDDARNLAEEARQRAIAGEYKIFIIDECHRLGGDKKDAWNALLKVIEECPKYTIFIFCTTEPEKVIPTVRNRLQRYNFTPISAPEIRARLEYICQQEGFTNYEQTCDYISKSVQGGMRDAITYLEQISDYSKDLNIEVAKKVIGGLSYETMFKLTWAITGNQEAEIISTIEELYQNGQDLKTFIDIYLDFILDLVKFILFRQIELTNIPSYLATQENAVVQFTTQDPNSLTKYNKLADKLLETKQAIVYDNYYKNTIIIMLVQAAIELSK